MSPSQSVGSPSRLAGISTGPIAGSKLQGDFFTRAKAAVFQNFEAILVLLVLGSLLLISTVVVHKFAFLLFYFVPVLMAGFYLGARYSVAIAILTAGFVTYLNIVNPFETTDPQGAFGFWNLFIWASFLTLTGAIVGRLQEKNNLQMKQLRDAYVGIIEILTKYLESADDYTRNHSQRVADVSAILAEELGFPAAQVSNVRSAALLHDIGKIEVLELVRKEGSLSAEEKVQIDRHTELGAELILKTGTVLNDVIPAVLDHHRYYKDGGDDIPYGARIIAVADTYDAVRTDRPYRAGRLHHQAVEVLEGGQDDQWDPKVVQALKGAERRVQVVYTE